MDIGTHRFTTSAGIALAVTVAMPVWIAVVKVILWAVA